MVKDKKEAFYIGIHEPQEFRRELLSSCKTAIVLLKRFEIEREDHKKKANLMVDLNKILKEITFLVGKINTLIPDYKLRELPSKIKKEKSKVKSIKEAEPVEKEVKMPKKHVSELEKLERELQNIEKRMTSVNH